MDSKEFWGLARELEELKVDPATLETLDEDSIAYLNTLAEKKAHFKKFNKLAYWKPYTFQRKWMRASNSYRQRYLSAANRCGKTYGACMELAMHITGLYPDWYDGKRIEEVGEYWVVGVSQESVKTALMKELLGVDDYNYVEQIGTGSIPRDCINLDSMGKEGGQLKKIRIRHTSGEENTLHFFASTQALGVFMGAAVHYILLDEQFPNETEIYSECLTRTASTRGMISVTCTPLQGETDLWKMFKKNESGRLYFQNATWDDAEHLTAEDKAELLAGYPTWEHETRSAGIPTVGSGAVYPFAKDEIEGHLTLEEIKESPFRYKLLWSCDFGYSNREDADPSTLVLCAYDAEEDKTYAIYEWNSKPDFAANRLSHLPPHMASVIKSSAFPYAPLLVPHDGKKQIEGTNTTRLSQFKALGINVLPTVFEIPAQLTAGVGDKPKHPRSLDWTLSYMNKMFYEGKLKLDVNKLPKLMEEFRGYRFDSNGIPYDRDNHHLDALRYAAISVKYKGAFAGHCHGAPKAKWSNGRRANEALQDRQF